MSGLRQKQKERRRRDILDAAARLLARPGESIYTDSAEAISTLLCTHFEGLAGRYDKVLFREFLARTFTRDFGYGGVMATLAGRLAAQVKELLEQLQKRGQLAPEVRTDEAAGVLYSLFIGHLRGFAFIPELTLDAGRRALERSVALVFSGLTAPLSAPPRSHHSGANGTHEAS